MTPKRMHCQEELEAAIDSADPLSEIVFKMAMGGYSTSAHLWTLYALAAAHPGGRVYEIGCGRSTLALIAATYSCGGSLTVYDRYDYRLLFRDRCICKYEFRVGDAELFFKEVGVCDFVFFDYMSTRKKSVESCYRDLKRAVKMLPTNGIVAVHDAYCDKYNVGDALEKVKAKFGKRVEVLTLPYGNGLGIVRRCDKSPHGVLKDKWRKKPDAHA